MAKIVLEYTNRPLQGFIIYSVARWPQFHLNMIKMLIFLEKVNFLETACKLPKHHSLLRLN